MGFSPFRICLAFRLVYYISAYRRKTLHPSAKNFQIFFVGEIDDTTVTFSCQQLFKNFAASDPVHPAVSLAKAKTISSIYLRMTFFTGRAPNSFV